MTTQAATRDRRMELLRALRDSVTGITLESLLNAGHDYVTVRADLYWLRDREMVSIVDGYWMDGTEPPEPGWSYAEHTKGWPPIGMSRERLETF